MVRDKNGPVSDLTKEDFILIDRGRPQNIRVFSAEPLRPSSVGTPAATNTFSDAPDYGANAPSSINIVLLDNLNTLYGSTAQPYESTPYWFEDLALANGKAHLVQYIEGLPPTARVALYGLSDSLHVLSDFTSDREQLLSILKRYDPRSKTNRAEVEPGAYHTPVPGPEFNGSLNQEALRFAAMLNANRARVTMAALESIAAHVANIPGRKNLVWITANLPFSGQAMARLLAPAQIAAYMVDSRGLLTTTSREFLEGSGDGDALAKGNFAPAQAPQPIGIETMRELAQATGGEAFVNTNDLTGAIRQAVEGSNASYTLGFYVDPASLDGKFHELKLQVRRKGLSVRYPSGYFALPDRPSTNDEERERLAMAVHSPLQSSAILVHAALKRVDRPAVNSLEISTAIDLHDLELVQDGGLRRGAIDVYVVEQDQTGKVLRESQRPLNLQLTEKEYSDYLESGILIREAVKPQPGATTLRLVVQDRRTAAIGSLIIPISEVK